MAGYARVCAANKQHFLTSFSASLLFLFPFVAASVSFSLLVSVV